MLSKTSQRKTNTIWFSLMDRVFKKKKKTKLTKIKIRNGDF